MSHEVSPFSIARRPAKDRPWCAALALLALSAVLGPVTRASAQWTDVTSGSLADPGTGYGVSWGDYDGDGDLDLCLTQYFSAPQLRLFRNDGGGVFTDVTAGPLTAAEPTIAALWADADNDGDLDLFRSHFFEPRNVVYRNDAGAFATAAQLSTKGSVGGAAWGDYDLDGKVDLVFVNHAGTVALFRNLGGLVFASGPLLGQASLAIWVDFDGDGDPDLHLVALQSDRLLRNDGGAFVDLGGSADSDQRGGAAWGDYDNDGDPDAYLAMVSGTNRLRRNDGAGVFTDVTVGTPLGLAGDSRDAAWVDFDNDGDLDLFVVRAASANVLFRNDGGVFVNNGPSALDGAGTRRSVAWADFDGDGDLDAFVTSDSTRGRLVRNDLGPSHWLHVDLAGVISNRAGIGARVRVKAGGTWRMQDVSGGAGISQGSLTAEFGLGSSTVADSVEVRWPSGFVQSEVGVPGNQRIVLSESAVTAVETPPNVRARLWPPVPNPNRGVTLLRLDVASAGRVRVEVMDLQGRCVRLIADREFAPGGYDLRWDGKDSSGRSVSAGLYRIVAGTGRDRQSKSVVQLR